MSAFNAVMAGLTLLASVSPLFTAAKLFQVKEWRFDRLREHLRREGWLRQLFGLIRPAIIAAAFISGFFIEGGWLVFSLMGMILLSAIQFILKKQPMPVWTKKTVILVALAFILTAIDEWLLLKFFGRTGLLLFPVLPLLQFAYLFIARLLFLPVDQRIRKNIFAKTKMIREKYPELTVIGITGSAGKTTTKEVIKHLLSDLKPIVTPEHVNTELGVALWLAKKLEHISSTEKRPVVVEMGDYHTGELELMASYLQPTVGVITLIGPEHLALFGSMENVIESKRELLRALPANGHAFLNGDNPDCRSIASVSTAPVTLVESKGSNVRTNADGIQFTYDGKEFSSSIQGAHQITNILLAIGVARTLGVSDDRIAELLKTFSPLQHTFNVRKEGSLLILDDTYNATPMSIEAGIAWAKSQNVSPKTLFTTGVFEMGDEEERIHEELGRKADGVFDRIIFKEEGGRAAFEKGFGKAVELFGPSTKKTETNGLLACIGRVGENAMKQLLP